MKIMSKKIFIIAILIFAANSTHAATFSFSHQINATVGKSFPVTLSLDPEKDNVNAISGTINIPNNLILEKIDNSSGVVTSWVETPEAKNHQIVFSGIIVGGFQGLIDP